MNRARFVWTGLCLSASSFAVSEGFATARSLEARQSARVDGPTTAGASDDSSDDTAALSPGFGAWPPAEAAEQRARETRLLAALDPASLARWHEEVASFPHVAGSPGDARMIAFLAESFERLGLEVEVHPFVAYLPAPLEARLELLTPTAALLPLIEQALPGVPGSEAEGLDFGWNAYSGSGTVEGELVYANYGRKEDFEELARLGVPVAGRIVIARYGGNYRGYKAYYAEAAGAAGLVIYTDPRDSGFEKGLVWPEGGWANDSCIQRGSILTLPWVGDPLTPGIEATPDAARLDPDEVALPKIPVQPIGWSAAVQLLAPMRGKSAPKEWQGGLPLRYRLTGGPGVRARLMVRQERRLVSSANVLASLRGRDAGGGDPEARGAPLGARILVGSHHDAWSYGASDPTSGLIAVLEAARVCVEDARRHGRMRRTLTFAAWGAEEFGIIGSGEYVESRRAELIRDGVLYVNLDAAANGLRFGAAATPEARRLVSEVLAVVPQPRRAESDPDGLVSAAPIEAAPIEYRGSVLEAWAPDAAAALQGADWVPSGGLPSRFGELGGGSDHAAFLAWTAMPAVNLSAFGAEGTAYHSNYDDLQWYRATVGSDYASALLVARVATLAAARAAEAPLVPIALAAGPAAAQGHLEAIQRTLVESAKTVAEADAAAPASSSNGAHQDDVVGSEAAVSQLRAVATIFAELAARAASLEAELESRAPELATIDGHRRNLNELLLAWPRAWLDEAGLPGRPWFKNLYVAPNETSGYASWALPGIQKALADGDSKALVVELERLRRVAERLTLLAARLEAACAEGE